MPKSTHVEIKSVKLHITVVISISRKMKAGKKAYNS